MTACIDKKKLLSYYFSLDFQDLNILRSETGLAYVLDRSKLLQQLLV